MKVGDDPGNRAFYPRGCLTFKRAPEHFVFAAARLRLLIQFDEGDRQLAEALKIASGCLRQVFEKGSRSATQSWRIAMRWLSTSVCPSR